MSEDPDPCQELRLRVEAIIRWLLDVGDLTPMGARQIQAVLKEKGSDGRKDEP